MSRRRQASHANSWYSGDEEELSLQLDRWLEDVPESAACIGPQSRSRGLATFPTAGARVIIAPHAGYSYSGPAAAWAYKSLDLSKAVTVTHQYLPAKELRPQHNLEKHRISVILIKRRSRIFVLGPSHHFYLTRCALSQYESYKTPLGDLELDLPTIAELHKTGQFDRMSASVDAEEHSIEMHLPYIHKILTRTFSDYVNALPPIIPILVGNTSASTEQRYGQLLAPYLADPSSAFVISSDFCHWGSRFRYTYYQPAAGAPRQLNSRDRSPTDPPIHESIAAIDMQCIAAVERGQHQEFLDVVEETGNTVCGRHPIGIIMAAMEEVKKQGREVKNFSFTRYERSSDCTSVRDSSVSYASAFAVV